MTIVKTTLSLTDHDRQWMDGVISSGEYVSNSEYIRSLIRQDKEKYNEIEAIRLRLVMAEQVGFTKQNAAEILAELKDELYDDGKL